MKIFNRAKGRFDLTESDLSFVTTEFGTKLEEKSEIEKIDSSHGGDVLVSMIGEFGKFQFRTVLLIGFMGITFSWANFSNKFLTYEVDFWCSKVKHKKLDF